MTAGNKRQAVAGVLALVTGLCLILYVCLANRRRIGMAVLAAAAVAAGLLLLCAALTEPPAHGKGAQNG